MGWMKGYQFKRINELINEKLNLSKEIRIISFRHNHDRDISNELLIGVYDDKKVVEEIYINPKKSVGIEDKNLTREDNKKLREYLSKTGMDYLDYQLYLIDYKKLLNRVED